jgi:hypothetical protein
MNPTKIGFIFWYMREEIIKNLIHRGKELNILNYMLKMTLNGQSAYHLCEGLVSIEVRTLIKR